MQTERSRPWRAIRGTFPVWFPKIRGNIEIVEARLILRLPANDISTKFRLNVNDENYVRRYQFALAS